MKHAARRGSDIFLLFDTSEKPNHLVASRRPWLESQGQSSPVSPSKASTFIGSSFQCYMYFLPCGRRLHLCHSTRRIDCLVTFRSKCTKAFLGPNYFGRQSTSRPHLVPPASGVEHLSLHANEVRSYCSTHPARSQALHSDDQLDSDQLSLTMATNFQHSWKRSSQARAPESVDQLAIFFNLRLVWQLRVDILRALGDRAGLVHVDAQSLPLPAASRLRRLS